MPASAGKSGPWQIGVLRDLRQRSVSGGIAEGAVNRIYQSVNEMELIDSFIRRKFHSKTPLPEALEDPRQLASAYRRLIRAGFSSSNVIQALKRISKRQDLLEGFETSGDARGTIGGSKNAQKRVTGALRVFLKSTSNIPIS